MTGSQSRLKMFMFCLRKNFSNKLQLLSFEAIPKPVSKLCIFISCGKNFENISAIRKPFAKSRRGFFIEYAKSRL